MKFTVREIVFLALFVALNVILTRFVSLRFSLVGVEGIRIGIGALPVILAGVMFGPVSGGIVGALGDLIGYYLSPMGVYMPHFTLTAALTGIIPGLFLLFTNKENINLLKLFIAVGTGQLITTVVLTSFFLNLLFGIPYVGTVPAAVISEAITLPAYAFLTKMLLTRMSFIYKHT